MFWESYVCELGGKGTRQRKRRVREWEVDKLRVLSLPRRHSTRRNTVSTGSRHALRASRRWALPLFRSSTRFLELPALT